MGKKDIAIWGTGRYGNLAYYYYKDICNIKYYIDSDKRKWGEQFHGIEICSPNLIYELGIPLDIIIAIKDRDEVIRQLKVNPVKGQISFFQISNLPCEWKNESKDIDCNTVIVSFCGGLGNQMFQYALLRKLQHSGKKVLADLNFYFNPGRTVDFWLTSLFPSIQIETCSVEDKYKLVKANIENNKSKKFLIYREKDTINEKQKRIENFLLDITGGYIEGYHQNYIFAESISDILLQDFTFKSVYDSGIDAMCREIQRKTAVSVHIRRGDYLEKKNIDLYGGICTTLYYKRAMQYMQEKYKDVTFYFFSNDMEWVRSEFEGKNAVFVEQSEFEDYHDWYDMYLMSQCSHNIIANSTFSWWAAWLNQNPDKTVIAPKQWINDCIFDDIYPKEWVIL